MKTMEELRHRIGNVEDVQAIVSIMKTMAAVQIRQYESAADAIGDYLRTIELGFHVLLRDRPLPDFGSHRPNRGAIIFGSDQGLCGKFNEEVAQYASEQLQTGSGQNACRLIIVGHRAAQLLTPCLNEIQVENVFRVPTTADNIASLLLELMPHVDAWRGKGVTRINVYFNSRTTTATFSPSKFQLFPIPRPFLTRCQSAPWNSRGLPTYSMDWSALFSSLIRQYLFVGLYRACAESRASENASRISSMQTASKNIDQRLHELRKEFNQSRQAAITDEILDIAAGVEALNTSDHSAK